MLTKPPAWSSVINPSLCLPQRVFSSHIPNQLEALSSTHRSAINFDHKGSFRHTSQTSPSTVETSWHQQSLQWRPTCSCHHQAFQPGFLKFKTTPLGFLRITTQSIKEPLQALQPDTFTLKREKKKKDPANKVHNPSRATMSYFWRGSHLGWVGANNELDILIPTDFVGPDWLWLTLIDSIRGIWFLFSYLMYFEFIFFPCWI